MLRKRYSHPGYHPKQAADELWTNADGVMIKQAGGVFNWLPIGLPQCFQL
jgi:hypothetical protein